MTAAEIVALRAPAYADDSRLSEMITLAEANLSSTAYGDHYNQAVALLVLHWYTKEERGGAGGPIASEKEGGLARSYSVTSSAWDDLASTSWGVELNQLTKRVMFKPLNRMMSL